MVRIVWAGKIAAGKAAKAFEVIPKMKELFKKYDGMPNSETFLNMFGESGVLIFMVDFADLAAFQKVNDQNFADPERFKLAEETAGIFVEGSIHTYVLKNI